jgi:hypothetical protein
MKILLLVILGFILPAQQTYAQTTLEENLVVFHSLGPNWKMRAEYKEALQAHRKIYEELAQNGDILFGGRFQGEPVLGMSVFRSNIDRESLMTRLKQDPSVVAGVVNLEFRVWQMQLGKLPDATRQKVPQVEK